MQNEYAKSALNYTLENSVIQIEKVYEEAIKDFKNNPNLFKTLS
ncbi:glycosyltransferase family 4 protein, partial [Helicobacter pylori]